MRSLPVVCVLAFGCICLTSNARSEDQPSLAARLAARHELELAKIDLRNYWLVEYPRQKRELDAAIEITKMEICNNDHMQEEFRPFTRFTIGEPFPITIRNLQMCRQVAEVRLKNLEDERAELIRFHGDQFRALEMKVQEARLRVAQLEGDETLTPESAGMTTK
jgi:hypothetical protein